PGPVAGAARRPGYPSFPHLDAAGNTGRSLVGGAAMERGDRARDLLPEPFARGCRTPDPPRLSLTRFARRCGGPADPGADRATRPLALSRRCLLLRPGRW